MLFPISTKELNTELSIIYAFYQCMINEDIISYQSLTIIIRIDNFIHLNISYPIEDNIPEISQ